MAYVNDNQVRTRLGVNKAGTPVYSNLNKLVTSKVATATSTVYSFSLANDASFAVLQSGQYPAVPVYENGGFYEEINGALATAKLSSLGSFADTALTFGDKKVNLFEVLDVENDEVLKVVREDGSIKDVKYVYALLQTDLSGGTVASDGHIQLSFVVLDDASDSLVEYTLPAGNYKYQPTLVYNLATLAEGGFLDTLLEGGGTNLFGDLALDEIIPLLKPPRGYTSLKLSSDHVLPANKKVIITLVSESDQTFTDTTGANIVGTETRLGAKEFDASLVGSKLYDAGGKAMLNGVTIPNDLVSITDTRTVEINLSESIFSNLLYLGDRIELEW